jgi:transcriptional regulator with XRE-family HTH domain
MPWTIYNYVHPREGNLVKTWSLGLQKKERAKLNAKIDALAMHGPDLIPGLLSPTGVPSIFKLKIRGQVQLRPRKSRQNTTLLMLPIRPQILETIFWHIPNGGRNMSEFIDKLRSEFQDEEYRHAYADECLNTMIATQIKVLREQRGMTQGQLADATGMKQPRIPLLEDATYENWTVNTLKRFAKAFDVVLSVKFETFSRMMQDFANMSRESLERPKFENDPIFQSKRAPSRHRYKRRRGFQSRRKLVRFPRYYNDVPGEVIAAAAGVETNRGAAKRKKPARAEELASGPITRQLGLGEIYA